MTVSELRGKCGDKEKNNEAHFFIRKKQIMSTITQKTESGKAKTDTKVSEEQRRDFIEVAAYHTTENGEYNNDCDLENWLLAEVEIDRLLAEGKFSASN